MKGLCPSVCMACLPVAEIGDPILRQVAQPVPFDSISSLEFQAFLVDLVDTLRMRNGVGIAAPQVFRSQRAIAIECSNNPRYPDIPDIPLQIWIDPEILDVSANTCRYSEGCLSVPGRRGDVERPEWIRVAAYNPEGGRVEFTASGFLSRILQHEIDHLNGILFVDRLDPTFTNLATINLANTHSANSSPASTASQS